MIQNLYAYSNREVETSWLHAALSKFIGMKEVPPLALFPGFPLIDLCNHETAHIFVIQVLSCRAITVNPNTLNSLKGLVRSAPFHYTLLIFKNSLLFLSSMFTVAKSEAASDMYSGDAPPCSIIHKYNESATKEISYMWLELLLASPLCLSDCPAASTVYMEHSYTADLSCCPEELI